MKTKTFFLTCVLLITVFSSAQTRRTSVSQKPSIYYSVTDLFYDQAKCYYTSGKYTPEELKNTEILTSGVVSNSVFWPNFINQPADMTDEQYNEKIRNFVSTCPLVKGEFWENLRKEFLKKFNYQIEIEKLESEAIKNPAVLKNSPYAKYCKEYVDILNGSNEKLMAAWKDFVTNNSKYNSDPQRIMSEFREKANEPNWVEHARKELIKYGWGSCINGLAQSNTFYNIDSDAAHMAFRKLFIKINEPNP